MRKVIAIDGPSGAGKSSVARLLAGRIGFRFLDSGAMYRGLALLAMRRGVAGDDEAGLTELLQHAEIDMPGDRVLLDGEDVSAAIRRPAVTEFVSVVAAVPGVRKGMVGKQRVACPGCDLVVEGRDIGSVVFPDAVLKVYLSADPGERAMRRALQTGRDAKEVEREQKVRDDRDRGREHSPLVRAPGAVEVDTTGLSLEEVVERLVTLVRDQGVLNGADCPDEASSTGS